MSRRLFFLASKHIVRFLLLAVAIIGLMVCADSSSAGEINAGSSVTQFSAGPVGQRCEKKFDSKKRAFSVAEVARLWIADEQILQSLARSATENTSQSLPVGALESVYPATPCLTVGGSQCADSGCGHGAVCRGQNWRSLFFLVETAADRADVPSVGEERGLGEPRHSKDRKRSRAQYGNLESAQRSCATGRFFCRDINSHFLDRVSVDVARDVDAIHLVSDRAEG